MTLTTNGKNYIAQKFGLSNCFVSSGLSWTAVATDGSQVNETGGTASIIGRLVTTSVYASIILNGVTYTYSQLRTANDNTDLTLTDAQWVAANDGTPTGEAQYCYTVTTGILSFSSSPYGAEIYINNVDQLKTTGSTFVNISVSPGTYTWKLTLSNYNDATGTQTVTAGQTYTINPTLTQIPYVYAMTLSGCTAALTPDTNPTCTLTTNCTDQYGSAIACGTIIWSSNNPSIATISSTGIVTALSQGTVTITAITSNGATATKTIIVNPATPYVYSMSLSGCNSALSTDLNPSCLLTASCLDQFGAAISCGSITWSSSNTSIATVNSSGTVTAISQGTATITATTSNGKTATRQITVNPISSGSITFTTPSTPGASIFLDGVLVGITSATITGVSLNISHSYILRLSGYNDYTGSITLTTSSPNQTVSATLVLTCTPNWQCELPLNGYEWDGCNTLNRRLNSNCNPVSTGSIKFISDPPGATIILDSTNLGQITTYTKDNVSVGDHSYILRKDGYKEYLGTVTVTANQTVTVSVTLEIQITLDKITLSDILNNYTCYGFTTPKDTFDCNLETFKVYAIYSNGYCDVPPTVNQFIWYKWDTIGLKFIEYMRTSIFTIGTGYCTTEANLPCNSMYKVVYGTTEKIITIQQQTVQEFGMGMAAVVLGGLFILSKIISKK